MTQIKLIITDKNPCESVKFVSPVLNYGDALIRPKVTYDFSDSFNIILDSNIFVGDERGMFGRYADNSMIYTKIKYNF